MLVEALGQLLGAAAFDEAVRPPSDTAVLQGVVAVAPLQQEPLRRLLKELGVPQRASRDLGRLVLRRELTRGGGWDSAGGAPAGSKPSTSLMPSPSSLACLPHSHQLRRRRCLQVLTAAFAAEHSSTAAPPQVCTFGGGPPAASAHAAPKPSAWLQAGPPRGPGPCEHELSAPVPPQCACCVRLARCWWM